jgi:hypothetical protein
VEKGLPGLLGELFQHGQFVYWIVGLVMVESSILGFLYLVREQGIRPRELLATQAAGIALLLALQAAINRSDWEVIALWLAVAFAAHLVDMGIRWRR